MQSNVVVSRRLLTKIAREYIRLMRNKKIKEAEQYIARLNPTPEFHMLIKEEVKEIINGRRPAS